MKNLFKSGDRKVHTKKVEDNDLAGFEGNTVHSVCSTFALAREMEWSSRLFVLDMLDEDEEGIGTRLEIEHHSPALEGERLIIGAVVSRLEGHEIICNIDVSVGDRKIATGVTGQKILKRVKIESLINSIKEDGGKEK